MTAPPSDTTQPVTAAESSDTTHPVTAAEPRVQPAGSRGRGGLLRRARHRGGLERRAPGRALPSGARRRGRVRSSAGKRPRERLAERKLMPWTPRRIGAVGGVWLVVTVICAGLVCYGLGPLTESRQQRAMLTEMRGGIGRAVGAQNSLFGDRRQPTRAPEVGDPVAIVQIPRLKLQQVIVEGGDSRRTQAGPGHVPGTAGPGQPGNSAVVARRYGFGAPFHRLPSLRAGDDIIISTTQGLSLYQVRSVERRRNLARGDVYAASTDDRLTLVTSASVAPWEGRRAVVVVATKSGLPFPAAPQGGRSHLQDGRSGDPSAVALIVLYAVMFAGTVVAAVLLYRRWLSISTYLLTTPIMIALIVLAAEAATRLLPAWA